MELMEIDTAIFKLVAMAITVLLGVIGYFLKQLHLQFGELVKTITDIDKRMAVHEEQISNRHLLTDQRIQQLEHRINAIEDKLNK